MKFSISAKAITVIIITCLILAGSAIFFGFRLVRQMIDEDYKSEADCLAATVAVSLDSETVKSLNDQVMEVYETAGEPVNSQDWGTPEFEEYVGKYSSIMETEEFKKLHEQMTKIQDQNDCDCIYLFAKLSDGNGYIYLCDAATEDACLPGVIDHFDEFDLFYPDQTDYVVPAYITNTEEYGWLVTAGAPIFDSEGNYICYAGCDYSMDEIRAKEKKYRQSALVFVGLVALGACIFSTIIVRHFVTKPLKILSKAASEYYTSGKEPPYDTFEKIEIKTHDEVATLANSMKKMERDINDYLSELLITTDVLSATEDWAEELKNQVDDNPTEES